MKTLVGLVASLVLIGRIPGQEAGGPSQPEVRFEAVDVAIDPGGTPLAAYQFEFTAEYGEGEEGGVEIVGIEGGEHAAFAQPPYYDPAALMHDRVIIAAFSTAPAADLPGGRTRVARLHLRVSGEPLFSVELTAVGDADSHRIEATVHIGEDG